MEEEIGKKIVGIEIRDGCAQACWVNDRYRAGPFDALWDSRVSGTPATAAAHEVVVRVTQSNQARIRIRLE
jgi:hypothetical protein